MQSRIAAKEFLDQTIDIPILDVRSPSEYKKGHIPQAINYPLFTDEQRDNVGTIYKKFGKDSAIKLGLELVGPDLKGKIEFLEKLDKPEYSMYCWRGGMRSESMAWLAGLIGGKVKVLEGGYKAYRKVILNFFEQETLNLTVLTGFTGARKTEILSELQELGEQVVDFEAIANHQGSSFGNELSEFQPTTENFQNELYRQFIKCDLSKRIWVEDEPNRIGKVNMPDGLYAQKTVSPHVLIEVDKDIRVKHLMKNYGNLSPEKLIRATGEIARKLGREESSRAISLIGLGDIKGATDIILTYYDKRYQKSLMKKQERILCRVNGDGNYSSVALDILRKVENGYY